MRQGKVWISAYCGSKTVLNARLGANISIAAMLLETGRVGFVLGKATMITLALLVLCMHKNFYLARWGLGASVATYTGLVGYHLWLL